MLGPVLAKRDLFTLSFCSEIWEIFSICILGSSHLSPILRIFLFWDYSMTILYSLPYSIGWTWSQISKVYLGSMCRAVLISWDTATPPPPHPSPIIWAHIRGRYWSAKIDDMSLWSPALHTCTCRVHDPVLQLLSESLAVMGSTESQLLFAAQVWLWPEEREVPLSSERGGIPLRFLPWKLLENCLVSFLNFKVTL